MQCAQGSSQAKPAGLFTNLPSLASVFMAASSVGASCLCLCLHDYNGRPLSYPRKNCDRLCYHLAIRTCVFSIRSYTTKVIGTRCPNDGIPGMMRVAMSLNSELISANRFRKFILSKLLMPSGIPIPHTEHRLCTNHTQCTSEIHISFLRNALTSNVWLHRSTFT